MHPAGGCRRGCLGLQEEAEPHGVGGWEEDSKEKKKMQLQEVVKPSHTRKNQKELE